MIISSEDRATLGSDPSAAERHRTVAAKGNALAVVAFTGGASCVKSWGKTVRRHQKLTPWRHEI